MNRSIIAISVVLLLAAPARGQGKDSTMAAQAKFYSFTMKTIDGKEQPLSAYKGDVCLVVNVASFCGFTPQYKDLEAVYKEYKDRGFRILAFPANNFGNQEPGTNGEIKQFCKLNYDVTFDMFSKISVKGKDQDPLYHYLTTETSVPGEIKWNFQKYLVDRKGDVVAVFPSKVKPTDTEFISKLKSLLDEKG